MKSIAKISAQKERASKSVPGKATVEVEMPQAVSKNTPMSDFEMFHAEKHIRRSFWESMQLQYEPAYSQILCLRELLASHRKLKKHFDSVDRVILNSCDLGSFAEDCYHFCNTPTQTEYSPGEIKTMQWFYNYREHFRNQSFLEVLRIYQGLAPLFVEHPRFSKIGKAMQGLVAAAMELTGEGGAK